MKAKLINITTSGEETLIPSFPRMPFTNYTNTFGTDTYDYIDWHWHAEIQYCIVLEGAINFRVDEHSYLIEKGGGILIPSNLVHMASPTVQDASYFCLDVNLDKLLSIVSSNDSADAVEGLRTSDLQSLVLNTQTDSEIIDTIKNLRCDILNSDDANSLLVYSDLFRLMYLTARRVNILNQELSSRNRSDEQLNKRLIKILAYIQEHYAEKVSLEQIALEVNLSSSECCRFFKQKLGQTIFEYLLQYRIQKGKEMIRGDYESIADVAYAVGFNSQSYFTSAFRKVVGVTPTEFIRRETK